MTSTTTTIQLKLLPTRKQRNLIHEAMNTYITTVNDIVASFRAMDKVDTRTSKDIHADLPSCLKNQCIQDAKSVFKKYKKACRKAEATCPVLKKPAAIWNNQNYTIETDRIGFPVFRNGKSTKIYIKAIIPAKQLELLNTLKRGTLRITPKGNKLIAQIAVDHPKPETSGNGVMGVDLGVNYSATSYRASCFNHYRITARSTVMSNTVSTSVRFG